MCSAATYPGVPLSSSFRCGSFQFINMCLLIWLLILTELEEMIFSENDHEGREPAWSYQMHTEQHSKTLLKEYTFWELNPRSAVLCPRGFFISTILYHFLRPGQEGKVAGTKGTKSQQESNLPDFSDDTNTVLRISDLVNYIAEPSNSSTGVQDGELDLDQAVFNLDHLMSELQPKAEHTGGRKESTDGVKTSHTEAEATHLYGLCSAFVHCLGRQACLFHLNSDLCEADPVPGFRKVLNMQIKCERDSNLKDIVAVISSSSGHRYHDNQELMLTLSARVNYVVFIPPKKKSSGDDSGSHGERKTYKLQEKDVFSVFCPSTAQAHEKG